MISYHPRDIRANMLLGLGMPRKLADRICDGPIGQSGRFTFRAADEAGDAEILLYDYIGYDWWSDTGITALSFKQNRDGLGEVRRLTVRSTSPGADGGAGRAFSK